MTSAAKSEARRIIAGSRCTLRGTLRPRLNETTQPLTSHPGRRLLAAAASAAVALALVVGGCSKETETSIYVEVFNDVGAPTPQQATVDIYAPSVGGAMGTLLGSKMVDVMVGQANLLGSLVILTGTRTDGLHVRAQGLVNGAAVSQGEIDVVIAAKKQVTAIVTLAAIQVHPDGGMDLGGTDASLDLVTDASKDEGADVDADIGDATVDVQPGDAGPGAHCGANTECASTFCVDGVCCDSACADVCHTCAPGGVCTLATVGTDPRNQCADKGAAMCMTDGVCDGAGACRLYAAGTTCTGVPGCVAGNSAVASTFACDGIGACAPAVQQDCKGFLCDKGVCGTTCTTDAGCTPTSFCSASACVRRPANLAGNGDLEYATTAGWSFFAGGALSLSNTLASGFAHAGQYSALVNGRSVFYQGPAYALPTGPGKYTISVWGMQNQNPTLSGTVSIGLTCNTGMNFLVVGTFGAAMVQGNWTNFTGTIDTSSVPDCVATATPPGVMKSAVLYLNQNMMVGGTPVAFPDLYLDDLVIQVTDGHNLVGNSNFEAGAIDGWGINGVATLAVSTTLAKGGTHSLALTGRSASTVGPKYNLPLGAARYNVTFNAAHSGTKPHSLTLLPTYTCLGGAQVIGPPLVTMTVAPNTWVPLTGSVTLPPATATAGCRLTEASVFLQQEAGTCGAATGQIECPDLFVDDVSVTMAP